MIVGTYSYSYPVRTRSPVPSCYFAHEYLASGYLEHSEIPNITQREQTPAFTDVKEHRRKVMAQVRAASALNSVMESLGFVRVYDRGVSWHLVTDRDTISITERGEVHVNGEYLCLVTNHEANCPFPDIITAKLAALFTKSRNKINTVNGKIKEALDRAIPISTASKMLAEALRKELHDELSKKEQAGDSGNSGSL